MRRDSASSTLGTGIWRTFFWFCAMTSFRTFSVSRITVLTNTASSYTHQSRRKYSSDANTTMQLQLRSTSLKERTPAAAVSADFWQTQHRLSHNVCPESAHGT